MNDNKKIRNKNEMRNKREKDWQKVELLKEINLFLKNV